MGLRDRLCFSVWFALFIKASLWFTNQTSAFRLASCALFLLLGMYFSMPYIHVRFCLPLFFFFLWLTEATLWTLRISVLSGSGFCLFACFVVVKTLCQVLDRCSPLQLYKTHGCHRISFCGGISNTVSSWDLSLLTLLDYLLPSSSCVCMKSQDKNTNVGMCLFGLYFGTLFPSFWKYTTVQTVGGVLWRNHSDSFGEAHVGEM